MIKVQNLTKNFGNNKGIFDLNIEVKKGQVLGFLGPNGAGKSTTIRHLMGFIKPQSGEVTINGLDCWSKSEEVKKNVGYIPGEISFPEGVSANDFIKLMAGMKNVDNLNRADELINRFQLDMKVPIKKMSKGMKQKLAIIIAFINDPEILILDEPSSGLDPLMQKVFVDLILEEKKRGKTILISSHVFDEIKDTADTICIIKDGKIIELDDINKIKTAQKRYINITFNASSKDIKLLKDSIEDIEYINENSVSILINDNLNKIIREIAKYDVNNIEIVEPDIKDIFIKNYEVSKKGE